jgi:hypothetical protein
MKYFKLIPYYFAWHYSRGIKSLLEIWVNYLWFVWNFFSVRLLIKTLFKPYRKINEYTKLIDIENESKIVTFIMSLVGFVLRSVVIVVGISAALLILIFGLSLFILWFLLPFILLIILITGVAGIIQ